MDGGLNKMENVYPQKKDITATNSISSVPQACWRKKNCRTKWV